MRPSANSRWPVVLSIGSGVAAAGAMAIGQCNPNLVEKYYSTGLYPAIAAILSGFFALLPFSCAQIMAVCTFVAIVVVSVKRGALWGIGVISLVYALFVGLWGLNYTRPSMEARFSLESFVDDAARKRVLDDLASRTNAIRRELAASSLNDLNRVPDAQDSPVALLQKLVLSRLGLPAVSSGRIKFLYPSDLLQLFGYTGVYWPWTGEPHVNDPASPAGLAMNIAHERAHLSGFAKESEANFIAYITTWSSSSPAVQYSGLLAFWRSVRDGNAPLENAIWEDIAEVDAFSKGKVNRAAKEATRMVYDTYLKANNDSYGYKSYRRGAEVVLMYLGKYGFPQLASGLGPPADLESP